MTTRPRAQVRKAIEDLIPRFMANRRGDVEHLRAALAEHDWAEVKRTAHRLKGSGAGYGFVEVSTLGASLEQAARGGTHEAVSALIEALDEYLNSVEIEYQ